MRCYCRCYTSNSLQSRWNIFWSVGKVLMFIRQVSKKEGLITPPYQNAYHTVVNFWTWIGASSWIMWGFSSPKKCDLSNYWTYEGKLKGFFNWLLWTEWNINWRMLRTDIQVKKNHEVIKPGLQKKLTSRHQHNVDKGALALEKWMKC